MRLRPCEGGDPGSCRATTLGPRVRGGDGGGFAGREHPASFVRRSHARIAVKINDAIIGALLAALGALVLFHVQSFPKIPGQQYGPGLFPGTIALGFLVCGVLLMVSGIRNRAGAPWVTAEAWVRSPRHVRAVLVIVAGLAAYIVLADIVGFLILAPLLLFLWFAALGVRVKTAVIASIVTTLVIWFVFYKLLRVPLPWGVLTRFAF
jgi:putative tricarboxylic transport membrane protein